MPSHSPPRGQINSALPGALGQVPVIADLVTTSGVHLFLAFSSLQGAGIGLYTGNDVRPGSVLTTYGGQPLTSKDICASAIKTHFYAVSFAGNYVIDSRPKGCYDWSYFFNIGEWAGFANSSDDSAAINTAYVLVDQTATHYDVDNAPIIFPRTVQLCATKFVRAGSELLCAYGGPNNCVRLLAQLGRKKTGKVLQRKTPMLF